MFFFQRWQLLHREIRKSKVGNSHTIHLIQIMGIYSVLCITLSDITFRWKQFFHHSVLCIYLISLLDESNFSITKIDVVLVISKFPLTCFHLISVTTSLSNQEKVDFMIEFNDWKGMKRQDCFLLNFGLPDLPSVPFPQLRRVIFRVISIDYIDLLFLVLCSFEFWSINYFSFRFFVISSFLCC